MTDKATSKTDAEDGLIYSHAGGKGVVVIHGIQSNANQVSFSLRMGNLHGEEFVIVVKPV